MPPASDVLTLTNVTAGYNGQPVIRDLSMSVKLGQLNAIIGPNGHGKTTMLRAISGLIRPMAGRIDFNGTSLSALRPNAIVRKGIVQIPQGDMIFADMSVHENLLMGAYLPSAHAERAKSLDYVEDLFPILAERANQPANSLSGGERRMLAIGRALMSRSEVLLIDEPSLGLAPIIIEKIYDVIRALKAEGRTIVLVEENASRIADFADTIHLLDSGRFVWSGTGAQLADNDALFDVYLGG